MVFWGCGNFQRKDKNMKKLIALLLLSPLAFAEKNEMISLPEYVSIHQDNLDTEKSLYITYRCIALFSAMPGILENDKSDETRELIDRMMTAQESIMVASRKFHEELFNSSNEEYTAEMGQKILPMAKSYTLESKKSYTNSGENMNEYLFREVRTCGIVAKSYSF
tara:strand:+ start:249 stop:743 length:495 start_codon:yes stop_codon:yes gene_type:complete